MDQVKIGSFIAKCRKSQNLTQFQLAEKLNITDRAISKWETGRAMPDSSIMLQLCEILKISVNDLLNGEIVSMEKYSEKEEKLLLEIVRQKEENDKRLFILEYVIGIFSVIILLGFTIVAAYVNMEDWLRVILVIMGFIICIIGIGFAIRIEQKAGYYQCRKCNHKYVPTFNSVFFAMHLGRTRFLKCPCCGKWSWNKKVLSKEKK